MTRRRALGPIVFCAAAGPRIGFGHLVRCRSLARALGVAPRIALRATAPVRARAAELDVQVLAPARVLARGSRRPALLVIDDPSTAVAARWLQRARRAGIHAATVHDLGLGYLPSDLLVDGTVEPGPVPPGTPALCGPAFAILDPAISVARRQRRRPRPGRILVALGGGRHVLAAAARLTAAVAARVPHADIRVATGFSTRRPPALASARWIQARNGLVSALADAEIALISGGVSIYEACALGVPVVAVAVTAPQHRTVRALARLGAAIDGGCWPLDDAALSRVAEAVAHLLDRPAARARLSRTAREIVDGAGARRTSVHLRRLAVRAPRQEVARAA